MGQDDPSRPTLLGDSHCYSCVVSHFFHWRHCYFAWLVSIGGVAEVVAYFPREILDRQFANRQLIGRQTIDAQFPEYFVTLLRRIREQQLQQGLRFGAVKIFWQDLQKLLPCGWINPQALSEPSNHELSEIGVVRLPKRFDGRTKIVDHEQRRERVLTDITLFADHRPAQLFVQVSIFEYRLQRITRLLVGGAIEQEHFGQFGRNGRHSAIAGNQHLTVDGNRPFGRRQLC